MSRKVKEMSQIKQLLQMHRQGMGRKEIARSLGMSKNTVKSYLAKLSNGDMEIEQLLAMDDPLLEGQFHAGNPSYKDPRYLYLESRLEHYVRELPRKGVTKHLLWKEYREECRNGYEYTQFCFHLNQLMVARNPTAVLTHKPGEKLYVDYAGDKIGYIDRETGEIIQCQVFVACLPYSDYCFVWVSRSQSTDEFVEALVACLLHLGGSPAILVPDNLKAAVIKPDRYQPKLNRVVEDFANYYDMIVLPARVARPRDKALCENQVKLLYSRVYAHLRNMQFFDLGSLREAVDKKVREHNQTRMQQKPYCRQERFLSEERPLLRPLPPDPFQIKHYRWHTVAQNGHIYMGEDHHYYSVPYQLIGRKAQVIYTTTLVSVYVENKCVAIHIRDLQPGGYTSVREHLASHHQHWMDRSPAYYLGRAGKISIKLVSLFEVIFADHRPAEHHYNACEGLLRLQKKTTDDVFNRALDIALKYKIYAYHSVMNLIRNDEQNQQEVMEEKPLPQHDNIRGKAYYKLFVDDNDVVVDQK
jgi:transposase